ncbi:MAG: tRNA epoxyqueuosine(34) reductase QueG [Rhodospirillaceae bacterium]|nr:tRNA epoxyqueuosine(34) reductase QueG [Rhodospirillaceae bacterium]
MKDKHLKLNLLQVRKDIQAKALELGFDVVGFAPADIGPGPKQNLEQYISDGRHGSMGWMAERMSHRASPTGLWPEVKSVISLGLNYAPNETPNASLNHHDRGTISVYARGRDYHDVMKKRLKALGRWMGDTFNHDLKVFVDTAPVMEKPLAQKAGIGWQGKHTNLVSREFGSWLFLGEIFTTLELPPSEPEIDHCGNCTACIDACPTGAIGPYKMDARKCVSYLTIEHSGEIAPELAAKMGNRIYGCDDCLNACPWNKFATPNNEPAFSPRAELIEPRLDDLLALDDKGFRDFFSGSPIKRIGVERMTRNALIAKKAGQ